MVRSTAVAACLGAAALLLAGCAPGWEAGGRLRVVAAFYPLEEAARQVGGAAVSVRNLTAAGSEPHDLELSPRQVDDLDAADVVLYVGGGFQPAVEELARRRARGALDLLDAAEPGRTGGDPHFWLDPVAYARAVDAVAGAFAAARPAAADRFRANAARFVRQLEALDAAYRAGLAHCDRRTLVTSHEAFGHLAARYGLREESVAGLSPEAEPDPERLASLARELRESGATTVFAEELVPRRVADVLAREAGVGVAVLDPLEGLGEADRRAGRGYVSVMRANLAALRQGLGCT